MCSVGTLAGSSASLDQINTLIKHELLIQYQFIRPDLTLYKQKEIHHVPQH